MSERKFKFVSPGVFIDEIDNSQLSRVPGDIGPVIIGRTQRGPAMQAVKVNSFSEFVEVFGNPVPGGDSTDVWRNGNYLAPTYAAYAAQAWLKNNNAATIVRLVGHEHTNKTTSTTLYGQAGWNTGEATAADATVAANGGAYGLFMANSGTSAQTGTLAAILYAVKGTAFALSGTRASGSATTPAAGTYVKNVADKEFILVVSNSSGAKNHRINFTDTSPFYIRKVLNTNPTKTNNPITAGTEETYWLGESYEGAVKRYVTSTAASSQHAWIAALQLSTVNAANKRFSANPSRTGWVIHQHLTTEDTSSYNPEAMSKLFRFIALENGEWEQQNLKISIMDIKKSTSVDNPYGTFTVVIRMANDSDNAPAIVERYSNVNLNPNSTDYISKRIGDTYSVWSDTDRRHRWYGRFPSVSKYIRMDMNVDLDNGAGNSSWVPFGFFGTPRFKRFAVVSTGSAAGTFGQAQVSVYSTQTNVSPTSDATFVLSASSAPLSASIVDANYEVCAGSGTIDKYVFPAPQLRVNSSEGTPPSLKNCYWGIATFRSGSSAFDPSYYDMTRILGGAAPVASSGDRSGTGIEDSYVFTLDNVSASLPTSAGGGVLHYISGSRALGTSFRGTATGDGIPTGATSGSLDVLLKTGVDRFTMSLHGGFDGLDIREKEPFSNRFLDLSSDLTPVEHNNYAYNSIKRAIDTVSDPEVAEYNLMLAPGITHEGLTSHMINVCEDRGDAMAIIDLKGDYKPFTENSNTAENRKGTVLDVVTNLENRALNTSYGCCYYPWVQVRDPQAGNYVWVPPSVVALGTMASSEKKAELWFAPAGFNRGGLTEGSAGLPVVNVADRLSADDRDTLYAANINPIATFPAEGIVIFGQKTLQATPSALDRINVRRLMIYVKKEISRMATRVLFDQNVQATWNRFLGMVKPFLRDIKIRFGLTAFKVVLDETTTTPDLIDRNILYAKIFLKPARAIEFIALDFTITNSGASFED